MEEVLAFALELVLEVVLELAFGLAFDGAHDAGPRRLIRVAVYSAVGFGLGWISALVWPNPALLNETARLVWLGVSPAVGGGVIAALRSLRGRPWSCHRVIAGALFLGLFVAARSIWAGR